jgi:hypothetical protein
VKKTNGKANGATLKFAGTFDEMQEVVEQIRAERRAKLAKLAPPYEMTVEEETEMLARWRLKPAELDEEHDKCITVLNEIVDEVESLAESVAHSIYDDEGNADALMASARSLADVSARMMRYAGRLEAYREAKNRARKTDEMIDAWKNGGLGIPAPDVRVGETARRRREDVESEATE